MQVRNYRLQKNGLFIFYFVIFFFSIVFGNFFSAVIFGLFPAIWIFKLTKKNLLLAVPVIFAVNLSILIVSSVLLFVLHIPIYMQTLLAFNLVIVSIIILLIKRDRFELIDIGEFDFKPIIVIYLIFGIAFVARVYSVIGDQVPILHDPISHAYWARTIDNTHSMSYLYSPGLHVLLMAFAKSFNMNFGQSALYVTNFFNAATVLAWGAAAYLITKSKFFTISLGVTIFALPYPHALYSAAGKNSLIVAIAFAPFVFLFLKWFLENTNMKNSLLLSLSLLTVIFIHLPTGFFVAVTIALFIVSIFLKNLTDRSNREVPLNLIKYSIFVGLITVLLSGLWYIGTNEDRVTVDKGVVSTQKAYGIEKVDQPTTMRLRPRTSLLLTYHQFKSSYDAYGLFYAPFVLASLLVITLLGSRTIYISILLIFFSIFGICAMIILFQISSLDIITETGSLLAFPLLALSLSGGLTLLWDNSLKSKRFAILGIIIVAVISFKYGLLQYRSFSTNTAGFTMVDKTDVSAFKWIEQNTSKKDIFLNDAKQHDAIRSRIYPTSGASWLPVYTGNQITMGFHNALYNQNITHKYYRSYVGLETNFQESFCNLYNSGVRYYYHDLSTPYIPPLEVLEVSPVENFKKVYSNSGVSIYKLQVIGNECKK